MNRCRRESGFVAVMVTLLMVLLIVAVGFTVDIGNFNIHENRIQSAAEAAALGGAPYLPDDYPSAEATARQIAANHGYGAAEVSVSPGATPFQIEVTISDDVDAYFARVIGYTGRTITKTSTAAFQEEVELGSPTIGLGNDPESAWKPDYWLSVAGSDVKKDQGDRFNTTQCSNATIAGCTGTSNDEVDPSGYKFAVTVTDTTQPLRIQVFDPAFAWVGGVCDIPNWPSAADIAYLQTIDDGMTPGVPSGYYDDADQRYAPGDTDWCTGDDRPLGYGTATTFTVRMPDQSRWDDNDNPLVAVCAPQTFGGYEPQSVYQPANVSMFDYLDPAGTTSEHVVDPGDGVWTFAEVFRRWVTICEIAPGPELVAGNYVVQVQAPGGGGQNRFSLRAGPPSGPNGIANIGQSTFARGAFPIFANTAAADVNFFLARVPPAAEDRILTVTFFDVGDASNPGQLQVLAPPDSNMPGGRFDTCTFTKSDGAPPIANGDCSIINVHSGTGYDGQLVTAQVSIPASYDCNWVSSLGCWVSVNAKFAGGITDFTTWTASIDGDPVRIVS